jgi:hypothetical protein
MSKKRTQYFSEFKAKVALSNVEGTGVERSIFPPSKEGAGVFLPLDDADATGDSELPVEILSSSNKRTWLVKHKNNRYS